LIRVLLGRKEEHKKEVELYDKLIRLGLDEREIIDNQLDDKVPLFVERSGTEIFDCWGDRKNVIAQGVGQEAKIGWPSRAFEIA
jgi:hypothetical protein